MEQGHGRQTLSTQLTDLEHDLLEMGSRAEAMVNKAVEALVSLDSNLAHEVLLADDEIDEMDLDIEQRCIRLLALQQPMAGDLRVIGTAMKMITDIERIGDLSVDVAKAALKIEKELGDSSFVDIRRMGNVARAMIRESLDAYVRREMTLVESVIAKDDEVDALYRELRAQIHQNMREHPDSVVVASWMLLCIHHLERVADHAVNIAERVAFMMTGKFQQLASSHRSDMPNA